MFLTPQFTKGLEIVDTQQILVEGVNKKIKEKTSDLSYMLATVFIFTFPQCHAQSPFWISAKMVPSAHASPPHYADFSTSSWFTLEVTFLQKLL